MLQLDYYFTMAWVYVASVGWYIVASSIVLWYTYPYIKDKYIKWKIKKDEEEYAAKYHKSKSGTYLWYTGWCSFKELYHRCEPDPDIALQTALKIEAARQKMQEDYTKQTLIVKKQMEELKKKEKEAGNCQDGNILGHGSKDEASTSKGPKSKSFKSEYNPLMGDSSRGYRPPKRSCCGKGGCG